MNVRELKKFLEGYPEEMPVVALGHFGEPMRISTSDFEIGIVNSHTGWADPIDKTIPLGTHVLKIPEIDIGPDPC